METAAAITYRKDKAVMIIFRYKSKTMVNEKLYIKHLSLSLNVICFT